VPWIFEDLDLHMKVELLVLWSIWIYLDLLGFTFNTRPIQLFFSAWVLRVSRWEVTLVMLITLVALVNAGERWLQGLHPI